MCGWVWAGVCVCVCVYVCVCVCYGTTQLSSVLFTAHVCVRLSVFLPPLSSHSFTIVGYDLSIRSYLIQCLQRVARVAEKSLSFLFVCPMQFRPVTHRPVPSLILSRPIRILSCPVSSRLPVCLSIRPSVWLSLYLSVSPSVSHLVDEDGLSICFVLFRNRI